MRFSFPGQQSITLRQLEEFSDIASRKPNFLIILANLLFSADNPFQSELAYISDDSYHEKILANMHNDYAKSGALAYVFKGQGRHFHSNVAAAEVADTKKKLHELAKK